MSADNFESERNASAQTQRNIKATLILASAEISFK